MQPAADPTGDRADREPRAATPPLCAIGDDHLPMQNREKIAPSRSSAVNSPVIADERGLRAAQFLGEELERGGRRVEMMRGGGEARLGLAQRDEMALAREEGAFHVLVRARLREDFVLQEIDAGPGLGRQEHVPPRGRAFLAAHLDPGELPARSILLWTTMRGSAAGSASRMAASAAAGGAASRASTITSARSACATAAQVRSMPSVSIGSSVGAQARGVDHA